MKINIAKTIFYCLTLHLFLITHLQAEQPLDCKEAYDKCMGGQGCHFAETEAQAICLDKGCVAARNSCDE